MGYSPIHNSEHQRDLPYEAKLVNWHDAVAGVQRAHGALRLARKAFIASFCRVRAQSILAAFLPLQIEMQKFRSLLSLEQTCSREI